MSTLTLAALIGSSCSYDESPTGLRAREPLAIAPNASAFSVVVTSAADDGSPGTLREAIAAAQAGTTITFDPSLAGATIELQPQPASALGAALVVSTEIVIEGPAQGITIDANQGGTVLVVPPDARLTLRDLTVTGGSPGGIYASGDLELERVWVTGNSTTGLGGGINAAKTLSVANSEISDNEAELSGGGIFMAQGSVLEIVESTIRGNRATDVRGGGIFSGAVSTLVDRSTISGNVAGTSAGGIYLTGDDAVIRNSTISANGAPQGGGLVIADGSLSLVHTTIAENAAATSGGGLYIHVTAAVTVENSIFDANQATGGPQNCGGSPFVAAVGGNVSSDHFCDSLVGAFGVIDPVLGPLGDNGGPTQTHAILRESPIIDGLQTCALPVDQRGLPRPTGPRCEPGAVEFDDYAAVAYAISPSGTADRNDGTAVVSGTATCEISTILSIRVTVKQQQKARRLTTEVSGSTIESFHCLSQTHNWAVAIQPTSGAFVNAPVEVTVETYVAPIYFERPTLVAPSVKLAWSRK